MGASLTPEALSALPDFSLSLLTIPFYIILAGLVGYPIFHHLFKFDSVTAYYASMPGGLQDMLIFCEEAGGNVRATSLIHATRILLIVALAPLLISIFWDIDLTSFASTSMAEIARGELVVMFLSGLIGWRVAVRLKLFGASVLGPMILTAIISSFGIITHRPPMEAIWAAQFFIGLSVGAQYVGITLRELRTDVFAGGIYNLFLAAISLCIIALVVHFGLADSLDATLAFLPGGQAEMVLIALISGADLTYVVSHHVLRMVLVILGAPIFEHYILRIPSSARKD